MASSVTAQAPSPTLALPDAITSALRHNPSVQAAAQQLAQAQARVDQAAAQRRFQLSFNSTLSASNGDVYQPPPSHETFSSIQNALTVPIPLGARAQHAFAQARAQYAAAVATYQGARLQLANTVAAGYYDVLRKESLLDVARESKTQADQQLTEAQRRFKAGDVPELDVFRAQVPVATATAAVQQAENDLTISRQALNAAMGQDLDTPVSPEPTQSNSGSPLEEGLGEVKTGQEPGATIDNNPATIDRREASSSRALTQTDVRSLALRHSADLQAAQLSVTAQEEALAAARRWREPSLSLQASDARSGDQTGFSRLDTLQASLSLPLDDGGLARGQIREAEAALNQSKAAVDVARQTATANASSAYLNAESAVGQTTAAKAAEEAAQVTYDKTILGYHNGLFPFSDVLSAQTALHQARTAYAQAIYQQSASTATLLLLIGRGSL